MQCYEVRDRQWVGATVILGFVHVSTTRLRLVLRAMYSMMYEYLYRTRSGDSTFCCRSANDNRLSSSWSQHVSKPLCNTRKFENELVRQWLCSNSGGRRGSRDERNFGQTLRYVKKQLEVYRCFTFASSFIFDVRKVAPLRNKRAVCGFLDCHVTCDLLFSGKTFLRICFYLNIFRMIFRLLSFRAFIIANAVFHSLSPGCWDMGIKVDKDSYLCTCNIFAKYLNQCITLDMLANRDPCRKFNSTAVLHFVPIWCTVPQRSVHNDVVDDTDDTVL